MKSPFRSKFQITQGFNERPEFYKKYGLKAHEGIDLIPTGSVWDVLCLADGIVVNESDDPRSGAYGIWITVWHPTLRKATQYCHLKENYVEAGDKVIEGQKLGIMGATGNVTGAHLHLNLFETDENGVRLNRENGYLGGVDPLLFLEQDSPRPTQDLQAELDKVRLERDKNWGLFTGLCTIMNVPQIFDVAKAELEKLVKLEDALRDKEQAIFLKEQELQKMKDEAASIQNELEVAKRDNNEARKAITDLEQVVAEYKKRAEEQEDIMRRLGDRIEQLKKINPIEAYSSVDLIVIGIKRLFGK